LLGFDPVTPHWAPTIHCEGRPAVPRVRSRPVAPTPAFQRLPALVSSASSRASCARSWRNSLRAVRAITGAILSFEMARWGTTSPAPLDPRRARQHYVAAVRRPIHGWNGLAVGLCSNGDDYIRPFPADETARG